MIVLEAVVPPIREAGQVLRTVPRFLVSVTFQFGLGAEFEEAVAALRSGEAFESLRATEAVLMVMLVVVFSRPNLYFLFEIADVSGYRWVHGVVMDMVVRSMTVTVRFLGLFVFKADVLGRDNLDDSSHLWARNWNCSGLFFFFGRWVTRIEVVVVV